MAKDEFFVLLCKLLCYLYDCLKNSREPDLSLIRCKTKLFPVEEPYWNYIMVWASKLHLVDGVNIVEMDGCKDRAVLDRRLEITPMGIEYLIQLRKRIAT